MKHKKKMVLIGFVLGAVLLAGIIGGAALAQTTTGSSGSGTSLVARVAAILGIDKQKVEDAFAQAQKDMEAERLDSQLKALVADGTLTQQQADQYKQWRQSMPTMPSGIGLPGMGGDKGMRGFGGPPPGSTATNNSTATTSSR
jgi:hypothetical protein